MTTRRALLWTGGGAVLISASGAAGWALTRTPRTATAPWRDASQSLGDPRLDALAFAVLAPNPHNRQPWRVALEGEDALLLTCAPDRRLPETDPFDRQITIGLGAFVELFRQAAAEKGYAFDIAPFPEGEPSPRLDQRPVARLSIARDAAVVRDPLFASALERRTSRAPFDPARKPPAETFAAILAAVDAPGVAVVPDAAIAEARAIADAAWRIEWTLDRTRRESIAVTRIGRAEIEHDPDGIALQGPLLEALSAAGMLTRAAMDDPKSSAHKQTLDFYAEAIRTAPAFATIVTGENSRATQLAVGAAWVRLHQAATREGVDFHPLSQALQEFPEMGGLYRRLHQLLAPQGGTVQMLARLGYATSKTPAAPRHPVRAILTPV